MFVAIYDSITSHRVLIFTNWDYIIQNSFKSYISLISLPNTKREL